MYTHRNKGRKISLHNTLPSEPFYGRFQRIHNKGNNMIYNPERIRQEVHSNRKVRFSTFEILHLAQDMQQLRISLSCESCMSCDSVMSWFQIGIAHTQRYV